MKMKDYDRYDRRTFLEKTFKYSVVGAAGLTGLVSMLPLANCKKKEEEYNYVGSDKEGLEIMMDECAKQGIKTSKNYRENNANLWLAEKEVTFTSDGCFEQEGNPEFGYIEFLSAPDYPGDTLSSTDQNFIKVYNSTPGTAKAKVILGGNSNLIKEEDLRKQVKDQIAQFGLK